MSATIDPRFCSRAYIADDETTVGAMLAVMTAGCEGPDEEAVMADFILATSPDRLDNPRKGKELWSYLRETFPGGRGVDLGKLAAAVRAVG